VQAYLRHATDYALAALAAPTRAVRHTRQGAAR